MGPPWIKVVQKMAAKTATILARGFFSSSRAKTAHGLIRYGQVYKIISVIDETLAGHDAGEVLGMGKKGIPIISNVDTTADNLVIGVAPSGGQLPSAWRKDIIWAIQSGLNIVSGLHEFLNDDDEFVELAREYQVELVDVRKPPNELHMAQKVSSEVPVVLMAGTDGRCGKRTAALELYNKALERGIDAGFIATGQTGVLIGADAGVVVDRLPADFVAGAVEHAVQEVVGQGKELIFIEGQGALLHHAYSTSTIGILYGAWPRLIVLAHPPLRKTRKSFPGIPMPVVEAEIKALNALLPEAKVVALALNSERADNYRELCSEYERRLNLPALDVLADSEGAERLLDVILKELAISNEDQ